MKKMKWCERVAFYILSKTALFTMQKKMLLDVKNMVATEKSKTGFKIIQPGIESLATSTLKLMKKGTTAFRNVCLLKFCAIYDIEPSWNLLIGFPGEGEDVYRKYLDDLPLLVHLPPPTDVYPVRFDRYSPYFMKSNEYGLDLRPLDYYSLIYPSADRF